MNYTVNRSYKINFTKSSGFKYVITSSKPSVTTIVKPNGNVTGNNKTINVIMYLNGLDAYNTNVITVTATDLLTGCTLTITDNLTKLSPCNDLIINIDNPDNTLTYKAIVFGKEPYSYKWSFNNNFEIIGINTSDTLNLRNITDVTPFNVSVEVTDVNECKSTKTVTYKSSCKPVINPIIGVHDCTTINNVVYNKYIIDVINTGCGTLVQDLIALDNTFIYGNKSLGNNKYELIIDRDFTLNNKKFYVKNNLGYKSNDFIVTLSPTKDCTKPINCVATIAENIIITIGSILKESNTSLNIIGLDTDYTTFKFIAVSPQTLTSNTVLNTSLGIATYSDGSIKHIFNNTGKRNDESINWSISNKCGDTITKSLTIKTRFVEVPDVSSKQSKLLKSKTATIKIDGVDSLSIIKNPTSGSATSTTNTITYNSTNIGVYSFEIIPSNDGATGLPFISEYEVVSSGSAINTDFCNLGLINLFDYVTGHSTEGKWYGVNNTMFISQANQIDFTSVAIGNYKFQYVVTAGSEQDVTTVNFNKFKFDIKSLTLIPSGLNSSKITIVHEGLLIDDIRNSIYILNGIENNIELDSNSTPTSFSFTVTTTETIRNLTYFIDTICGTLTKSYVKPDVQVSTYDIVGKGIAIAKLTKQNIKFVSAANDIVGKGVFLSPVGLLLGNQVICNAGMDVVFVLDYTASMGNVINNIKSEITAIKNTIITESNNNYRLGLVIFDEVSTTPNYGNLVAYTSLPSPQKIVESGTRASDGSSVYQYITAIELMSNNNGDSFTTQLNKLNTNNFLLGNGENFPEPSDIALYHISKTSNPITGSFRNNVAKLIILITDEVSSGNNDENTSADLDYINNTLAPLFTANNLKLLLLSTNNQTQLRNLVTASNGVYVNSFNSATIISTIQNICI